ncbi:MAG: glycosyltransferase [Planctomycetes bacterium]|nr:glycosyltransferase [Planctomycetota bacterium]
MGADRIDRALHEQALEILRELPIHGLVARRDDSPARRIVFGLETLANWFPEVLNDVTGEFTHWLRMDGALVEIGAAPRLVAAGDPSLLGPLQLVNVDWNVGGLANFPVVRDFIAAFEPGTVRSSEPLLEAISGPLADATGALITPFTQARCDEQIAISILVLSGLDNAEVLTTLLRSLAATVAAADDVEVVFVCNGSHDGSHALAATLLGADHRLTTVQLPHNRGIAGGVNAGLEHCRGRYVAFVQDDVVLTQPDWHRVLARAMDDHPQIGVLGADRGAFYFRLPNPAPWEIPYTSVAIDEPELLRDHLVQVDSANWIVCMFRRELGGMDENFLPNGIEDHDFNYRARHCGFEIWVTDVGIQHDMRNPAGSVTRRVGTPEDGIRRLSRLHHYRVFMDRHAALMPALPSGGLPTAAAMGAALKVARRDGHRVTALAGTPGLARSLDRSYRELVSPPTAS